MKELLGADHPSDAALGSTGAGDDAELGSVTAEELLDVVAAELLAGVPKIGEIIRDLRAQQQRSGEVIAKLTRLQEALTRYLKQASTDLGGDVKR